MDEKSTTATGNEKNTTLKWPTHHNIPKGLYHELRAPQGQALGGACFQSQWQGQGHHTKNWPRPRGTWLD